MSNPAQAVDPGRSIPIGDRLHGCWKRGGGFSSLLAAIAVSALLACGGGGGGGGGSTPPPPTPPTALAYSTNPAVYTKYTAIPANTPSHGGGAPAHFSVSPALPTGLNLNASTGVISGTPTTLAPMAAYTVTASNSVGSTTASLTLTVNDIPPSNLAYSQNPVVYRVGQPATPDLFTHSGGALTSCTVSPALPPGLILNTSSSLGVIYGTPTTFVPSADYTITATNSGGSATVVLTISLLPAYTLTYSANPAVYQYGVPISPNVPTFSGPAATYDLAPFSPALPRGLMLSSSTGVISGTPVEIVSTPTNYSVTASIPGGNPTTATISISITVIVLAPSNLTYNTNPATYTLSLPITPNTPSSSGGVPTSYTVAPALPAGLNLDGTTGVISGAPAIMSATNNYTITASNAAGNTTAILTITVTNTAPTNLTYSSNPATYTVGLAIPPNTPSNVGGAVLSYAVSPSLPVGLALNMNTGIITGTPAAASASAGYTVTATNSAGSCTALLFITVNAAAAPSNLTYSSNPVTYYVGSLITPNTPSSSGGAVVSYTVAPALPAGLVLDAGTGVMTGTPLAVAATTTYTVTATNASGSASAGLIITIGSPTAPSNLVYTYRVGSFTVGTAISPDTPSHAGGAVASYAVAPPLPAGIALDPLTGVISGTPTYVTAVTIYTVTASNASGSTSAGLTFEVKHNPAIPPPAITTQPADLVIHFGSAATFSVIATSPITLTYQWQRNDVDIGGATAATYSIPSAALTDNNSLYRVVITDSQGVQATSREATLTVFKGVFSATGSLTSPRKMHTATLLPNGNVLLACGSDGSVALGSADLYDSAAGTFSSLSLGVARMYHTATLLKNGKVLLAGGANGTIALPDALLFDPASNTYAPTGSLSTARYDHTATLLPDGKVLIAGGRLTGGTPLTSAEVFDPATGLFSPTGSLQTARGNHSETLMANGQVLIIGGRTFGGIALASTELYDPASGTFTPSGNLIYPRYSHTATVLMNGSVAVVNGITTDTGNIYFLNRTELYAPGTGIFSSSGNTDRQQGHTTVLLPDGELLITGGYAQFGHYAQRYDPGTGLWNPTGNMLFERAHHTATLLPSGKVLLAGGDGSIGSLTSAELYDPE